MNVYRDIDVQVGIPEFVVEREPNVKWHLDNFRYKNTCVLAYAKDGEAFYRFGSNDYTVKKGDVLFIRNGTTYSAKSNPDNPWSFFSCGYGMTVADPESRRLIDKLPLIFRYSDSPHMSECFSELNRIWMMRSKGYRMKCRSLLLDIIFMILGDEDRRRIQSAHYIRLNTIIDMMRENCDQNYSLDELCKLSGLSSSYFRQLFKQLTGLTTVQFQNHLKIDKAKDLLISRSCTVTEAALAVGFSDVYYFSRLFKQLTGGSPSEYLK